MMTLAMLSVWTIIAIGVVAVLIFGRRLPEVGRNLGQSLVEFKKGLHSVNDDVKGSLDDVKSAASDIDKEVKG